MPKTTLHAHVSTESADCDGRYSRSSVELVNSDEEASDFTDLDFQARILSNAVIFHGQTDVKVRPDGFVAVSPTEEGYVHTEVQWCQEERCQELRSTFRDHSAEAAGY